VNEDEAFSIFTSCQFAFLYNFDHLFIVNASFVFVHLFNSNRKFNVIIISIIIIIKIIWFGFK